MARGVAIRKKVIRLTANIKNVVFYLTVVALAAGYQGCGEQKETPQPELISISVEPKDAEAFPVSSIQFKATGFFSDSTQRDITNAVSWSSSDTRYVKIDANGLAAVSCSTEALCSMGGTGVTVTASRANISGQASLWVSLDADGPIGVMRF